MAVDATPKRQGFGAPFKPSTMADQLGPALERGGSRRVYMQETGAEARISFVAPYDGVVEEVKAQITDNSNGTGNNIRATLAIAGVAQYEAAGDGDFQTQGGGANSFQANDTDGTEGFAYPTLITAGLVTQDDGVARVEFQKGDLVAFTSAIQGGGTRPDFARYEVHIAERIDQVTSII